MNKIIYAQTITPYAKSKDGETATILQVGEENNGFAVFLSHSEGTELLEFFQYSKHNAINFAADNRFKTEDELLAMSKLHLSY